MRRELTRRVKRMEEQAREKIQHSNGTGVFTYEIDGDKTIMAGMVKREPVKKTFKSVEEMHAYIDTLNYENVTLIHKEWI